jgi:hypothetical protein
MCDFKSANSERGLKGCVGGLLFFWRGEGKPDVAVCYREQIVVGQNFEPRWLGLVHTFRFSTSRQVPLIAGQSSGALESIGVFTQPGRLTGREFTGRLPGSARIYPLLCPVAGR